MTPDDLPDRNDLEAFLAYLENNPDLDFDIDLDAEPVDLSAYPPSPVPSDAHLWPGEKPFTAFGQWGDGNMDNRVFDQDIYWVDRAGNPHLLTEMTDEYRTNVIDFLREHEKFFYVMALNRNIVQMLGDTALGRIPADILLADMGLPTLADLEPDAWLEGTPLMRALQRLTPVPRALPGNPDQ